MGFQAVCVVTTVQRIYWLPSSWRQTLALLGARISGAGQIAETPRQVSFSSFYRSVHNIRIERSTLR